MTQSRIGAEVPGVNDSTTPDIAQHLRDHGLQVTAQRIAVMEAVAGAVGEALANAGKHAQAERIVVYAEPDWEEGLFVSVKDDGVGFELETVDKRIGLKESITARIEAIGGRVEISSKPGRGTEVRLWAP